MNGRRGLWHIYLLLLSLAVTGCASIGRPDLPAPPAADFPPIESVPYFAQQSYQCGPAALAMLLNWADEAVTPQELVDHLYIAQRKGSLQVELMASTRRYGLMPYPQQGSFDQLWKFLAEGIPVLVLQNLAFSWYPRWHYAVVIGYDAQQQELLLRSGPEQLRREPLDQFRSSWRHSDFWMMSVLRPGKLPPNPNEQQYMSAASALESTGQRDAALRFYKAATRQWPDSMLPWMAVGNWYYQAAQYEAAEAAYQQAMGVAPAHPAPPHNLAWSLIRRGQTVRAKAPALNAVALSATLSESEQHKYSSAAQALGLTP